MATTVKEDISELNLFQKLSRIRKLVEAIKKNKKGFNYSYVTEDEILSKVTVGMDKYHLSLYPSITPNTTTATLNQFAKTKSGKNGVIYEERVNEYMVKSDMEWVWINDDNPGERMVVPWAMVGCQSDVSQAFGSGLTYSSRYFKLKFFNVATTDDDPDNFRSKQAQVLAEEEKAITQATLNEIHELCLGVTNSDAKKKDEVIGIVQEIAGVKNYFKIKDSLTASKLLQTLKEKYGTEENGGKK